MLGQRVLIKSYTDKPPLAGYVIDEYGNDRGMIFVWLDSPVVTLQGNKVQAIHVELEDLIFPQLGGVL